MAALLLLTSTGLSIDMHFCGNHIKSVSLFGKAKNCFELVALKGHCKKHSTVQQLSKTGCKKSKKDCCQNKTLQLQLDQDQQFSTIDVVESRSFQQFLTAFLAVFITNDSKIAYNAMVFKPYKPPLLFRNISILYQTFLL